MNILIQNGMVVPVDGTHRIIDKGFISVEGNKISAIGKMEELGLGSGFKFHPGFIRFHFQDQITFKKIDRIVIKYHVQVFRPLIMLQYPRLWDWISNYGGLFS